MKAKQKYKTSDSVNPITGLDPLEQQCMDGVINSYHSFLKMDIQHPTEMREFVDAVHTIQDILALRVVRRLYPEGWKTYKNKLIDDKEHFMNKDKDIEGKLTA